MIRAAKIVRLVASALSIALVPVSCAGPGTPVYSHFEQIGSDGWDPFDMLVFEPWPADSVDAAGATFDMDLVLRYSVRHHVADLPVAVTVEDENGVVSSDTIVIRPESGGNVVYKARYGVQEIELPLKRGVRLTDGYAVMLSPIAVKERSKGLLNVGIIMTPSGD